MRSDRRISDHLDSLDQRRHAVTCKAPIDNSLGTCRACGGGVFGHEWTTNFKGPPIYVVEVLKGLVPIAKEKRENDLRPVWYATE